MSDFNPRKILKRILAEPIRTAQRRADSLVLRGPVAVVAACHVVPDILKGLRQLGITPLAVVSSGQLKVKLAGLPRTTTLIVGDWAGRRSLMQLGFKQLVSQRTLYCRYPAVFLPWGSIERPEKLLSQKERITQAFSLFRDRASQRHFIAQLKFLLFRSADTVRAGQHQDPYFSAGLVELGPNTVYVDCGAFNGDTIYGFLLKSRGQFKKVVAFEPDAANFASMAELINSWESPKIRKIDLHRCAVGATNSKISFAAGRGPDSRAVAGGQTLVRSVSLDSAVLRFRPTLIKMDIEGKELEALRGGERVIRELRPNLAISVYHCPDDLWEIPLRLQAMNKKYKFQLRSYGRNGDELVLYAK